MKLIQTNNISVSVTQDIFNKCHAALANASQEAQKLAELDEITLDDTIDFLSYLGSAVSYAKALATGSAKRIGQLPRGDDDIRVSLDAVMALLDTLEII